MTEYRPKDHLWHTGLFLGWVHVNEANLWGGGRYVPEVGEYREQPDTHGRQVHERFEEIIVDAHVARVREALTWVGPDRASLATEVRVFVFRELPDRPGTFWTIDSRISSSVERLVLGASRAAHYSGLVLRTGPPFSDAAHRNSEGAVGHEAVMGSRAPWCCACGAGGGAVAMFDHPSNPRHPTRWFARRNLLGPALLWDGDMELRRGAVLQLRYGFGLFDDDPGDTALEALFRLFAS